MNKFISTVLILMMAVYAFRRCSPKTKTQPVENKASESLPENK